MRKLLTLAIWLIISLTALQIAALAPISWSCPDQAVINHITYSPQGQPVVLRANGTAEVWTADGNSLNRTYLLSGHNQPVAQVSFAPDGKTILTGGFDSTARLWDTDGNLLQVLTSEHSIMIWIAYLDNGTVLQTIDNEGIVEIQESISGRLLQRFAVANPKRDLLLNTIFSSDVTKALILTTTGKGEVWDLTTHKLQAQLNNFSPVFLELAVFSPDNKTLLTTDDSSMDATLWDTATGQVRFKLSKHTDQIWTLAYSSDSSKVVTASVDATTILWDTSSGLALFTLQDHVGPIVAVVFSPDGKTLATGSYDTTAKLWNATTGQLLYSLVGHTGPLYNVVFSPDGKTLATGGYDTTVKLWDTATGTLLHSLTDHAGEVLTLAYSPDGKTLASGSGDNMAKLWDVATGKLLITLPEFVHRDTIYTLRYSPDGRMMLTNSQDGTAKVWDTETGKVLHSFPVAGWISTAGTFYGSEDKVLIYGPQNQLEVYDSTSGTLLNTFKLAAHNTLHSYGPDGTTVLMTRDTERHVMVWDLVHDRLLLALPDQIVVNGAAVFSPDGKKALITNDDQQVSLWDIATDKRVFSLPDHQPTASQLAFSPDQKMILSIGDANLVKVWDGETGNFLFSLKASENVEIAIFSPDNKTILTSASSGVAALWDAHTGALLHPLCPRMLDSDSYLLSAILAIISAGSLIVGVVRTHRKMSRHPIPIR